ncbi:hypothetical protein Tco_0428999 [Tanacetum coccineum]
MNFVPLLLTQCTPPKEHPGSARVSISSIYHALSGVDRGGVGSGGCDDDVAMIMTVVVWGPFCSWGRAEGWPLGWRWWFTRWWNGDEGEVLKMRRDGAWDRYAWV